MRLELLRFLCDPISKEPLELSQAEYDSMGNVKMGILSTPTGNAFKITKGIPRFVADGGLSSSVRAFGDEWNHFNFIQFKENWLEHTVKNTFGSTEVFRGKTVVDAGGGSGAQTRWILESGAKQVVMLELSHSVDDVVQKNLNPLHYPNFDIIQCSIDEPPLRPASIDLVYCCNVIQHTPSVEKTAKALFNLVSPDGEFVFNCYPLDDRDLLRWIRFHLVYSPLRSILSRLSFRPLLFYSKFVAFLRLLPVLGMVLEKSTLCFCGNVPKAKTWQKTMKKRYELAVLNTFDMYGSHTFQHHKRESELRALLAELQPDQSKIGNLAIYFSSPPPIGCALRVGK